MNFTKQQIAEISGLSLRQVQFYTEEGLVQPEKDSGSGRGNVRKYSRKSLFEFLVIAELSKFGVVKKRIARCLNFVRSEVAGLGYPGKIHSRLSLFGRVYTDETTGKLIIDSLKIGGANRETSVAAYGDFEKYSSVLIFDISKLAERANKA